MRMLYVTGQVLPTNPAHSVRGPKHVVNKGTTPILLERGLDAHSNICKMEMC